MNYVSSLARQSVQLCLGASLIVVVPHPRFRDINCEVFLKERLHLVSASGVKVFQVMSETFRVEATSPRF